MRELKDMVDQGEFGAAVAERIREDLFEGHNKDQRPLLRLSVWRTYLKERTGHSGPYVVRRTGDPQDD